MQKTKQDVYAALVLALTPEQISSGKRGIERECLRVAPRGCLAQTPHPGGLGSALTHPYITTDYSEALLEFVTPAFISTQETLSFLTDLHAFTYRHIGAELLWPASMPCILGDDDSIPIANYGSSNVGMMKHIYRRGLGHRYGRKMQTIAGVHFNYSLPENFWSAYRETEGSSEDLLTFRNRHYFGLLRNFQRFGWIVPYLFGASPAICRSFLSGRGSDFQLFDRHTYYEPYATSLRMSDIGYKNKAQAGLQISYNNLDSYVNGLIKAIQTEDPEYAAIGTKVNGDYRQLNTSILQIENEYYSFIRPKQPIQRGERPTVALARRGVQYAEVRALDCDPYEPGGVGNDCMNFLEAFLIFCLLTDNPPITAEELRVIEHNQLLVARQGRKPGLKLRRNGGMEIVLADWAKEILDAMTGICDLLDAATTDMRYKSALTAQLEKVRDPDLTPAGRMLTEMRANKESFFEFGMRMARAHRIMLEKHEIEREVLEHFTAIAKESLEEQRHIEVTDTIGFEEYLGRYYGQSC